MRDGEEEVVRVKITKWTFISYALHLAAWVALGGAMASIVMKFFALRPVFITSVGVMVLSAVLRAVAERLDQLAE